MSENKMTLRETEKYLGLSLNKVETRIKRGELIEVPNSTPRAVTRESVEQYAAKHGSRPLKAGTISTPFISGLLNEAVQILDFRAGFFPHNDPASIISNVRYAVTCEGIVINLHTGKRVTPKMNQDGSLRVSLFVGTNHNKADFRLDEIVAYAWCENGRFATTVYPIDGDKDNINADNLVWLDPDESVQAQQLRGLAEAEKDYRDYNAFIAEKKQANLLTSKQRKEGIRWLYADDNTPLAKNELHNRPIADTSRLQATIA